MPKIEMLAKNTVVTWKTHEPQGHVIDISVLKGELQYLVEFVGADGEVHQRWFRADEIKEIEPNEVKQ